MRTEISSWAPWQQPCRLTCDTAHAEGHACTARDSPCLSIQPSGSPIIHFYKVSSPCGRPLTVGVGSNEHLFSMVRRTKGSSGQHFPSRIIPDLGQLHEDGVHAAGEQPAYVSMMT